jgi:lipopolysaccharide export LptBFGC system permease protein LptF
MKSKSIIGLVGCLLLFLSAGAHSILGWKAMSEQLAQTNAPADLVLGLEIDWKFGGPVMIAFAIICGSVFLKRLRGDRVSIFAPAVFAVMYTLFGIWALAVSGDPFFMVFVVPGTLVGIASIP